MKRIAAVLLAVCLSAVLLNGCAFLTGGDTEGPLADDVVVELRDENGRVWLNNSHVTSVSLLPDGEQGGMLYFYLNTAGSNAFLRATQENVGKTLALCINGEEVWTPTVSETIQDTVFAISSDDYQECIDLFECLTE